MKKSDWQYLVDTLLFICMCSIAFIGNLQGFFLAEGPTIRESEKYFLGLHRHQWGDIHLYLSLTFIVLIFLHLILAWSWIKRKSQALFKKRWGTAILATILGSILLILVFWIFTPKYPLIYENYGKGGGGRSGSDFSAGAFLDEAHGYVTITGNMTISQVEQTTGIPSDSLIAQLGLATDTSPDETLGHLRKRYGFTLVEARDAITALLRHDKSWPKKSSVQEDFSDPADEAPPDHLSVDKEKSLHEDEQKITRGRSAEDRSEILITGQMTLHEIEKKTGIPTRAIVEAIGLPQNVSIDEPLGRLRRRYGFAMQDVRDAVASLFDNK